MHGIIRVYVGRGDETGLLYTAYAEAPISVKSEPTSYSQSRPATHKL